jgi:Glyoxalase-like domain
MNNFLGIDHPLILVNDIEESKKRYSALGFNMTPTTKHPWGTSTSAGVMYQSLIEIMSIYDTSLLDEKPAGDFRFGRYINDQLNEREGVSLLALFSNDANTDSETVRRRGIVCQGTIEFGRDILLPDGRKDRTSTTLKIIQDPMLPRLSNFIVQQHRPDLIYVPKWTVHPNGATGIARVTILAERHDQPRVKARLAGLYGADSITEVDNEIIAKTGRGEFVVSDREAVQRLYGQLPIGLQSASEPFYAAIQISVASIDAVATILKRANISFSRNEIELSILDAAWLSNVFLSFTEASPSTKFGTMEQL